MTNQSVPVVDFDLLAATTQEESNRAWASARRMAPVVLSGSSSGPWLVTRYREVCQAFRDWEHFSSARTDPELSAISPGQGRVPMLVPEEMDPPDWYPMRRILAEILTPGAAEDRRGRVRHWCHYFLDSVADTGHCDFVGDLAVPVPAAVTMEMLGFPEAEWLLIATVLHNVSAYPVGHPIRDEAIAQVGEVMESIRREIDVRRSSPRDDAITAMVNARVDGEPLDQATLERLVFMVLVGGVDTTTAVSAAALVHLGRDTVLRQRLRDEPELVPLAMEEFLRMYPPARTHTRTVKDDIELGGCLLSAGDRVVLSELSANYDQDAFSDPETFCPERFPNRHVTFGMGIHRCAGSHIARIMLREIVGAALVRLPNYELDEEGLVEYPSWTQVGGWAHIPVRFETGR